MDKTLKKLVHLLRQIIDDAGYALVCNAGDDTRLFCIRQYNNVYRRLTELDPELASSFAPLSSDVSLGVIRISARDMTWRLIDYLRKQRRRSFWNCVAAFFMIEESDFVDASCC